MKRFIVALFLVMFYAGTALAFHPLEHMVPTADFTAATGVVVDSPGYLYGAIVVTDGTNAVTLDLFDSESTSPPVVVLTTQLIPKLVITTSASNRVQTLSFEPCVPYNEGVYASGSCAGTYRIKFYYRER